MRRHIFKMATQLRNNTIAKVIAKRTNPEFRKPESNIHLPVDTVQRMRLHRLLSLIALGTNPHARA